MTEGLYQKASLLYEQGRNKEAMDLLNNILSEEPHHIGAKMILASILMEEKKYEKAEPVVDQIIADFPLGSAPYFLKAKLHYLKDELNKAEEFIQKCIQIDVEDSSAFALWAQIAIERKDYEDALRLANKALEIDSANVFALNIRSTVLLKLKRVEESFETIEGVLREDPGNSHTHSNVGWIALEHGDREKALNHFKEALRNDPSNTHAQAGMTEALKSKYLVYKWFLKYAFWMGNMKSGQQWIFLLGFYFGMRFLGTISEKVPMLAPILIPILIVLAILALSTWIIDPLSNFLFMMNPYGRLLLDKEEKQTGLMVGISLCTAIVAGLIGLLSGNVAWYSISIVGFLLMIPLGKFFAPAKWKYVLKIYVVLLVIVGVLGILGAFVSQNIWNGMTMIFIFGLVGFTWVSNILLSSNR
ncbi:MAG: tetratricopeptide repeat protein [Saprospiraceae bacterium]